MIPCSTFAIADIHHYLVAVNVADKQPGIKEFHGAIDSEDKGLQENRRGPLTCMTGFATGKAAIGSRITLLCFTNSFFAGFKLAQVNPVIHHRKVRTATNVNFMITVELRVIVYIILLFHGVIFSL
jgi:hypothetical protein